MVATRRGTRVSEGAQETPTPTPTIRRTRNRTVIVTQESQPEHTSDSQQDDDNKPANPPKRETRKSQRRHTGANQTDSTHEADVSDSESCCSVASNAPQPTPRGRRRNAAQVTTTTAKQEANSEAESCSSSAAVGRSRKSTRIQKTTKSSSSVPEESQDNDHSDAESCSSVQLFSKVAETQMITRSRRRTGIALREAELSEPDSCSSPASSVPQGSTVRRSTRNRRSKLTEPIPINLEQSDSPSGRTRGRRGKAKSAGEELVYDSEGCQSGPSLSPPRSVRGRIRIVDSDSESVYTSLDSPGSVRGRGTPCSSRTGSASSNRGFPKTRSTGRVTGEGPSAETDNMKNRLVKSQAATDILSKSEAMEDVEEMEEDDEEANKTVINVDEERTTSEKATGDTTLTDAIEEAVVASMIAETEMLESESRQQTDSTVQGVTVSESVETTEENLKQAEHEIDVGVEEEPEKTEEPVVENKSAALFREDDSVKGELQVESGMDVGVEEKPEKTEDVTAKNKNAEVDSVKEESLFEFGKEVVATEEETNLVEKHDLKEKERQKSSDQTEKSVKVIEETEDEQVKGREETSEMEVDEQTVHATPERQERSRTDQKMVRVVEADESEKADQNVAEEISSSQSVTVTYSDSACRKMEKETENEVIICEPEIKEGNRTEDESMAEQEEEPCCSKYGQESTTKAERRVLSLLDSSEDEDESGDEGLSEEERMEDAESEEEVMSSHENPPSSSVHAEDNGLFVIDTRPGLESTEKYYIESTHKEKEEEEEDFVDEDEDEDSEVHFSSRKPANTNFSTSINPGQKLEGYIYYDGKKPKPASNNLKERDQLKKKESVIGSFFGRIDALPPYKESKQALKRKRREEREKTMGPGWFNMKVPEMTKEMRNDLKVLKMRSAIDPKRFYKKNDREGLPKGIQVGTVVDSPVDFYHSRIPKKERKKTIVEELLADAEFRSHNKRKYKEMMAAQAVGKSHKKKHKFNKKN